MTAENAIFNALAAESHQEVVRSGGTILDQLSYRAPIPEQEIFDEDKLKGYFHGRSDTFLSAEAQKYTRLSLLPLRDQGAKVLPKLAQVQAEQKRRSQAWLQQVGAQSLIVQSS